MMVLMSAGCNRPPSDEVNIEPWNSVRWNYTDLKIVQPPENIDPAVDMIALYTRKGIDYFQIRIDFLSLQSDPKFNLLIALDLHAGGTTTSPYGQQSKTLSDYWIWLSPQSPPVCFHYLEQSTRCDWVIEDFLDNKNDSFSLNIKTKKETITWDNARVEAFTIDPNNNELLDYIGTPQSAMYRPQQAPLLFAFWDTLPAQTPAQLLRRWNGAHTGPYGQRHGLKQLLLASTANRIPIFLLDLKFPQSLSGLNYIEQFSQENDLPLLTTLQKKNLIILPETAINPLSTDTELENNQKIARRFGFSDSQIVFAPLSLAGKQKQKIAFAFLSDSSHLKTHQGILYIPLPESNTALINADEMFANRDGITLEAKRALLTAATSADPGDLVVAGGSLIQNPMADSMVAPALFRYISNHPWIHALNESDLLKLPPDDSSPFSAKCSNYLCSPPKLPLVAYTSLKELTPANRDQIEITKIFLDSLNSIQPNNTTAVAWQALTMLTSPTSDEKLQQIQTNSLEIVGHLIEAARWENFPKVQSRCDLDIDWDGIPECLLSSDNIFASFEQDGARMITTFYRDPTTGVKQWIGATNQLGVGLKDPMDWKPDNGPYADPDSIPGAFINSIDPASYYTAGLQKNRILFTLGNIQKTFSVLPKGLSIAVSTDTPFSTHIPFIFSPQERFQTNWVTSYTSAIPSNSNQKQDLKFFVAITGDCTSNYNRFLDSQQFFAYPEDPNQSYPPGHYLPFPITLLNLQVRSGCQVLIEGK